MKYSTMQHRRAGHPDFASKWDVALVDAHARFHARPLDSGRGPEPVLSDGDRRRRRARDERAKDARRRGGSALRTQGGEPLVVRTKSGRLQVRPAHRGKLTKAAEQLFLQALAATANVRLSAAAAGASAAAFYRRAKRDPAFAREKRRALEMGYTRLECAAWAAAAPDAHADDAWFDAEPAPIPPMTATEAMHLLALHRGSVRGGREAGHRPRRRGESEEAYLARLRAVSAAELTRAREEEAVRAAIEKDAHAPPPELPPLPALDRVTGWSKASGGPPHHPGVPLFGGWRIEDMRRSRRK
ncbi:MAG: hypothetical protein JO013_16225 [Alphaproteobacteria bacterium]|nr:hypothetical protein [Alphaproteobacteria bacterium]